MGRHGANFDPNTPAQPAHANTPTTYSTGSPVISAPQPTFSSAPSYHSQASSAGVHQGYQPAPVPQAAHSHQYTMATNPYQQQGPMIVGAGSNGHTYNQPEEHKQDEVVYETTQIENPQVIPYNTTTATGSQAPPYVAQTPYTQPVDNSNESTYESKEYPVSLKSGWHIFCSKTSFRWIHTHHYRKPGLEYLDRTEFRHRDFANRVIHKPLSDRYLHHDTGYLRKLIVQTTDEIFEANSNVTWQRTYVRKQAPLRIRLATWVVDFSHDPENWHDWWISVLRALPASIAMTLAFWDLSIGGEQKYGGCYACVPYWFHGDAKVWSNYLENRAEGRVQPLLRRDEYRLLKPRKLCFLRDSQGIDIRDVSDWETNEGLYENLNYLFVAYSQEHFDHDSYEDMMALHAIAEEAARQAGLPAYWVASSCMSEDPNQVESDVYRISDVLRGAQELIIAVGQSSNRSHAGSPNTDVLLRQWGSRMWTFPEVLLSPGKHITVYTRGAKAPLVLSKNQFAGRVWADSDAETSRDLVDYFIGSISLSRLELSIILLKCLYARHTTQYMNGDQAYALMGLLRMRPQIDRTDSDFQAFARLSLANDSDQLLERYLCTLPLTTDQPWYNMEDQYKSQLWDITPTCQVAAICDNDTVIVDGAYGASIRWKSFYRIAYSRNPSWRRLFASFFLQFNGVNFILACVFLGIAGGSRRPQGVVVFFGIVFLALFLYFWIRTPQLVRTILGGKFTDVQAALFGLEGHLNAPTVERTLFGGNFGRMSWSINGSPLSRSYINKFGERVGLDPARDPEVRQKIEASKNAVPGQMRIFTLIDTYNMELTLFEAVRPPTCVFLCATEGGMRRAIACSYDWTTQTMYRETVLRMPTPTLNRMDRCPRVRMGIQRPNLPVQPAKGSWA